MAYVYSKNQLPTSGASFFFMLKTLLVSAGWTVSRSGDGLAAYSATGDILTTAAAGAGGLGNPRAWFILKQPAAFAGFQRQLCFQGEAPDSTMISWRIKYSANGAFTVGTSNATTTPSAADQVVLIGAGTDAAPSYGSALDSGFGTSRRAQFLANNAAPYEFAGFSYTVGGSTLKQIFLMDGMVSGSYDVTDVDPYVFYWDYNVPFSASYFRTVGNSTGPWAWYKKGLTGAAFVGLSAWTYNDASGVIVPGVVSTNVYNSKDQIYPLMFGRNPAAGAPAGVKGQSMLLAWGSNARNTGDTLTVVSTKDRICVTGASPECMTLPWDGTIPSV